jgi:sodium-dependent dicarboxylate transporter 2/3/5
MGSLIGTPPNAIAVGALVESDPATTISFLQWLAIGFPPAALTCLCLAFFLLRFYPPASSPLAWLEDEPPREATDPVWYRPLVALTMLMTVGLWLTSQWHHIPTAAVSFLPIVVFTTTGILGERQIRGLSYDVLFLMAGGLALGQLVTQTGLSQWIVDQLPLESFGPLGLAIAVMITAILLSNLMSNTATANILMPLAVTMAPGHAAELALPIAFGCSAAMILPVATPPNAMVYATGRCAAGDLRKVGLLVALIVPLVGITWLRWVLPSIIGPTG